jgi:hypothetical protein
LPPAAEGAGKFSGDIPPLFQGGEIEETEIYRFLNLVNVLPDDKDGRPMGSAATPPFRVSPDRFLSSAGSQEDWKNP